MATDAPPESIREIARRNPLAFGSRILGRRRWSGQQEIRLAVEKHRRVHVRSGHSLGKTHEFGSLVCEWLLLNPGGRAIVTGPSYDQVKDGVWKEVVQAYESSRIPLGGEMGKDRWTIDTGWDARIASVKNLASIQGGRGSKCLIIVDEAHGVEEELWKSLNSLMSSEESRMVIGGNPIFTSGKFFDYASSPLWFTIRLDAMKHPNIVEQRELIPGAITQLWIDELVSEWGEDHDEYRTRVLGQFARHGANQLIGLGDLEACEDITPPVNEQPRAGLDVALEGDQSAMVVFDKNRKMVFAEEWREPDLMATTGRALEIAKRFGALIRVDCIGLGAGVGARIREQGYHCDLVNFGEGPQLDWPQEAEFVNRRAELYFAMRQCLRERTISIPKEFRKVHADLCAPRYTRDSAGRLKIEAKDNIRKRIGRSPDLGDAAVIALSNMGSTGPIVEVWG